MLIENDDDCDPCIRLEAATDGDIDGQEIGLWAVADCFVEALWQ